LAGHVVKELTYPGDDSNLYRITEAAFGWYNGGSLPSGDLFAGFSADR